MRDDTDYDITCRIIMKNKCAREACFAFHFLQNGNCDCYAYDNNPNPSCEFCRKAAKKFEEKCNKTFQNMANKWFMEN